MKDKFKDIEGLFDRVLGTLSERDSTHGDAMESWDEIARRWSYILGVTVSRSQALLCMSEMKRVRFKINQDNEDNIVDDIGFLGLYWKSKNQKENKI